MSTFRIKIILLRDDLNLKLMTSLGLKVDVMMLETNVSKVELILFF
jgi:hypothetical protein